MIICLTSTSEIMRTVDDALLEGYINGIADGRMSALEELYHSTSAAVYGYALSVLKNTHDAEDVLHDCYISINSSAHTYKPQGKPMAWILTITRNLCLLKFREKRKAADIPEEDWQPYIAACEGMSSEDRIVLTECMRQLSDDERQIIILHAAAGFKHREIAGTMSMPLATVLSKYNRAIKKLRKYLEKGDAKQ